MADHIIADHFTPDSRAARRARIADFINMHLDVLMSGPTGDGAEIVACALMDRIEELEARIERLRITHD